MEKRTKNSIWVIALVFLIRSVAAVITTATTLNPESRADAIRFGQTAEAIAKGIVIGEPYMYINGGLYIDQLWGSFLAPFWLLPGPSALYARLGNAFLGAFAVYNVYLIARYYHSHQAGVVAVVPMVFYPSFVAVQSTLLRESIILFGITTAARLLIITSRERSRYLSYALTFVVLYIAYILRTDNVGIYAAAIGSAVVIYAIEAGYFSRKTTGVTIVLSLLTFILALPIVRDGVKFLSRTRELRAHGRAVYLPNAIPQTILQFVAFSWIGAAYFLYAPFPWMIHTLPDLLISIEGIINIGFTVAAVWGVRSLGQMDRPVTVGLLVGLAVSVILYGVGTANYGTAMRHRQMFLWVIFLFGGIGFSERVKIVWPFGARGDSGNSHIDA